MSNPSPLPDPIGEIQAAPACAGCGTACRPVNESDGGLGNWRCRTRSCINYPSVSMRREDPDDCITRLAATVERLSKQLGHAEKELEGYSDVAAIIAERDAALAEVGRLRDALGAIVDGAPDDAELAAAKPPPGKCLKLVLHIDVDRVRAARAALAARTGGAEA